MNIIKNITTQNFNLGNVSRIKYIVIHYTGNDGDTARGNSNYFKSYRGSSAHYFADENEIVQSIEDKNIAWHCGTKGTYYHKNCRNSNSIGVELCSRKDSRGSYYFKDRTIENAVELVRYLMAKYNIPVENVIRHYDVTHKNCPAPFVSNNTAWQNFKKSLTQVIKKEEEEVKIESINIITDGVVAKADAIVENGVTYVNLRHIANATGYNVGYNNETKARTLNTKYDNVNIEYNGNVTVVKGKNIEGRWLVPVRSICDVIGKACEWVSGKVVIK